MSCGNRREEEAIVKKPRKRINGEGSIYQRKSDGRWVGQFKDPTAPGSGIRYVYASTQQEALKKLKEEMARAEAGLLGEAARTNIVEYLGWWMENVVSGEVAHRTYHNYLSQIRNHIVPRIGKKKLKALKLEEVEDLYRSMIVSGLSPATIRYVHAVLRRALKQAVVRGLVPCNVAEGASLPRTGRKEIESFTPEEVRRFLRAAKHDRLQALYVLAVTCGLRQAELLGLRWDDVDLGTGRLTVRRQVQRSRDGSGMITGPTKNKKSRIIRLGEVAIEALKAHRERQAEEVAKAKGFLRDPDLVFASTIGTPLDPSNLVSRSFKPPQLLDAPLRTIQTPVDQERVGVGRYLRRDPGGQPDEVVAKVSPRPKTLLRLEMAISMCCLAPCRRSERSVVKRMPTSARAFLRSSLR